MITEEEYQKAKEVVAEYEKANKPKYTGLKGFSSTKEAVNYWYDTLSTEEAEILAEKYSIPRGLYAPWQMGHYEDRLRVYLGEHEK